MSQDLSQYQLATTVEEAVVAFVPNDPQTGNPMPITLMVVSADHAVPDKALDAIQSRRIKRGRIDLSSKQLKEDALTVLAASVISWEGVEWQGKPLHCDRDNVVMILKALPFLRRDLEAFVNDVNHFFPKQRSDSSISPSGDSVSESE